MPNINKILIIFEPIIAPIAISDSSLFRALNVTNNSGKEVPKPIMKIPVINPGTFSLLDKETEPTTSLSPPIANSIIPSGKKSVWINIFLFNNQKNNSPLIKYVRN